MPERPPIGRGLELGLCGCGLPWAVAATILSQRSAHGLCVRFGMEAGETLLSSLFLIFLLVLGFQVLDWVATRQSESGDALLLPRRASWRQEWGRGAALGWGLSLAAALPVLLSGNLHGYFSWSIRQLPPLLLATLTVLAVSLAEELIFRGYLFGRLMAAVGSSWATILSSAVFAFVVVSPGASAIRVIACLNAALFGILLANAYVRTRALWFGWGLHFCFRAVMLLLVGLPVAGYSSRGAVMNTFVTGPDWLTGGGYGLDAAVLTAPLLLAGLFLLFHVTREFAWHYTFRPPVGAGYEVVVPPPRQHTEMEQQLAQKPALVQILPTTPKGQSATPHPQRPDTE